MAKQSVEDPGEHGWGIIKRDDAWGQWRDIYTKYLNCFVFVILCVICKTKVIIGKSPKVQSRNIFQVIMETHRDPWATKITLLYYI